MFVQIPRKQPNNTFLPNYLLSSSMHSQPRRPFVMQVTLSDPHWCLPHQNDVHLLIKHTTMYTAQAVCPDVLNSCSMLHTNQLLLDNMYIHIRTLCRQPDMRRRTHTQIAGVQYHEVTRSQLHKQPCGWTHADNAQLVKTLKTANEQQLFSDSTS